MENNQSTLNLGEDYRKDTIALKYLELARNEILERVKIAYQTLIVYSGGIGAIAGWILQRGIAEDKLPFGVVVPFLAVIASWILYQNEKFVCALGMYQLHDLAEYFKSARSNTLMWEQSKALRGTADKSLVGFGVLFEACLILAPAFACTGSLLFYIWEAGAWHMSWLLLLTIASAGFTSIACDLFRRKYQVRKGLRDEQEKMAKERESKPDSAV